MATLEKIREKQGLLFAVIIIALFLFIITLAGNPFESCTRMGMNGTVLEAGKTSIDWEEFNKYRQPYQNRGENQDNDQQTQSLLNQYLNEKLIANEAAKLGIAVPDELIIDIIENFGPYSQAGQLLGINPQFDVRQFVSMVNNPQQMGLTPEQLNEQARKNGFPTMQDLLKYLEDGSEITYQRYIIASLVGSLFTSNNIDAKTYHADNFNTRNISYVSIPLSADATEYTPTDAEIKARYETVKPMNKLEEETRLIDFVLVPVRPSAEDEDAAAALMAEKEKALNGEIENFSNSAIRSQKGVVAVETLKKDMLMRNLPDSVLRKDGVYMAPTLNDVYTLVKFNDIYTQVDSINFDLFRSFSREEADSVYNGLLDRSITFKQLAADMPQNVLDSVWDRCLMAPQAADNRASRWERMLVKKDGLDKFNERVNAFDSDNRSVVLDSMLTQNGFIYNVFNIRKHTKPVQVADIEVCTLELIASPATISKIKGDLTSFIAGNNNADKFIAAADTLYPAYKSTAVVGNSSVHFNDNDLNRRTAPVKDSREIVKWVMNADKGDVSKIFEHNDCMVVATIRDIYKGDYLPYNSPLVSEQVSGMVVHDKKAQAIADKYKDNATDLAALSAAANSPVLTQNGYSMSTNNFGSMIDPGCVYNYEFLGKAAGAQPGTIYGPVPTANSVVYFTVADEDVETREANPEMDGSSFLRSFFNYSQPNAFMNILLGGNKVENHYLKYEHNEVR